MKHRHYDLMMKYYADMDAYTVEYRTRATSDWKQTPSPKWLQGYTYRLAPKSPAMYRAGSKTFPAPVNKGQLLLSDAGGFYVADPSTTELHFYVHHDSPHLFMWCERGLLHSTEEAAIEHAKALCHPVPFPFKKASSSAARTFPEKDDEQR